MLLALTSISRLSELHDTLLKNGQVTRELRNTLIGVQNLEIGIRAYLPSGSDSALEPYRLGRRQLQETRRLLHSFTYSPLLSEALPGLEAQIEAEFTLLEKTLQLRRRIGSDTQALWPLLNDSRSRTASLSAELSSLINRQSRTVESDKVHFGAAANQATLNLLLASATSVGLLLAVMLTIGRGIGRRRAAEQAIRAAEARRSAVLENVADGVLGIDSQRRVIESNPSVGNMLGYSASELTGLPASQLLVPAQGEWEQVVWQPLLQHLDERIEIELLHRSGRVFSAELGLARVADTELYTLTLRDISLRLQRERELIEARTAAEAASRAKSEFLANMSHELRTPLNIILGYSELMQESLGQNSERDLHDDLSRVQGAGRHLLAMIGEILDMSKIEAGKMTLTYTDFEPVLLIREVYGQIRPLMQANGNTLLIDCASDLGSIYSDRTRLCQCLLNLLSNAAKFTQDGKVTLIARRQILPDSSEQLKIDIIDTGIGMSEDLLERLFEPFTQADSSATRQQQGTGLGLALTRRLARLLGGELTVVSEPGHGSTFSLMLPAQSVSVLASDQASGPN